jgi:hypothetical protein
MTMQIHWTKCSESMPPDDAIVMLRKIGDRRVSRRVGINIRRHLSNREAYEWAIYSDEAWELLNDDRRRSNES